MKFEIVCSQCGKLFWRSKKLVNLNKRRGNDNVCSFECRTAKRKNGHELQCAACGELVYKTPSKVAKTKSGYVFCSKSCANGSNNSLRSGENHPNYLTGIGAYRKLAFETYGKRCTVCGYDTEQVLEVHHRNKDRTNNTKENLDVLCPTHHAEFDWEIREYVPNGLSSNLIGRETLNLAV